MNAVLSYPVGGKSGFASVFLQPNTLTILDIILSNGSNEWQHKGRNVQSLKIFGKHFGHFFCKMFKTTMPTIINNTIDPITANGIVPDIDSPKTAAGVAINMSIK